MKQRPITKTRDIESIRLACPTCGNASLALEGKLNHYETPESKKAHEHDAWDPSWISEYFSAIFKCGIKGCEQHVICTGKASYYEVSTMEKWEYAPEHEFEYFSPAIKLIEIPQKTPESVKEMLTQSMSLFFSSPSSSSNALRIAAERLLDHQGIRKFDKKTGTTIPLHQRILEFTNSRNKLIGEKILAIKWIGNHGSHSNDLTHESVADSYEIFESVLIDMFDRQAVSLAKKVVKINKKKRP